jgi:hypothetical protein
MWDEKKLSSRPSKDGFRLRGMETTRMETFIDAAFAFAITMLVISIGDIPDSYSELIYALKGTPAFAMSFAAVLLFWLGHRRWSRRCGFEDGVTIFISMSLVFLVLVFVYPLKLMFSALGAWATAGWLPSEFRITHAGELIYLFIIYGLGFAFLTILMAWLNYRTIAKRKILLLNEIELMITKQEILLWLILGITGFSSALFALIFPPRIAIYAGFVYFSLPFTMNFVALYYAKKIKRWNSDNANN